MYRIIVWIKPEPQSHGCEFCVSQIGRGMAVIPCYDSAVVLEFIEEALDEVSFAVEGKIAEALDSAVSFGCVTTPAPVNSMLETMASLS